MFKVNLLNSSTNAHCVGNSKPSQKVDDRCSGQLIQRWKVAHGHAELYLSVENLVGIRLFQSNKVTEIPNYFINGIPKEICRNLQQLQIYLKDTYIKLVPLGENELKVYINPRLRGGGLGLLTASVGAVGGYLTSKNYVNLAKEAATTVKVAGQEMRATVQQIETSTEKTINTFGQRVDGSINNAESKAKGVLTKARKDIEQVIARAGIEGRHTAKFVELQVEQALIRAAKETTEILNTAGLETREAIKLVGKETRDSCFVVSREFNTNLKTAREQSSILLAQGSKEIMAVLGQATRNTESVVAQAGREFSDSCIRIIDEMEQVVDRTLTSTRTNVEVLMQTASRELKGLIVDLGIQGRLLIKDTGQEVRITANEVLANLFKGQEAIIGKAGEESRLTIQEAGKELRSTLHDFPFLAGQIAQQVGLNLIAGMKEALFGLGDAEQLIIKIKNLVTVPGEFNSSDLIDFVGNQSQLKPEAKFKLYVTLVRIFNDPHIPLPERNLILTIIGIATLKDEGLIHLGICYTTDYRWRVISEEIPSPVREAFDPERLEQTLNQFNPVISECDMVQVEEVDPLEEMREELEIVKNELSIKQLESKFDTLLLTEEIKQKEELVGIINQLKSELAEKDTQLLKANEELEKKRKTIKDISGGR